MRRVGGDARSGVYDVRLTEYDTAAIPADTNEACEILRGLGVLTVDLEMAYNATSPPVPPQAKEVVDIVMRCAARLACIDPYGNDPQVYVDQMLALCFYSTLRNTEMYYV
jgi:hypothetical protein